MQIRYNSKIYEVVEENSPDYSGRGKLPDGREIRIVSWRENNYINLSFEFIEEEKPF